MRRYRFLCLAFLLLILLVSLGVLACSSPVGESSDVTSLTGTWVGKGYRSDTQTERSGMAMLIVMQEGNSGSISAKGEQCFGTQTAQGIKNNLGNWITPPNGQGPNSSIQGNDVDLTLVEAPNGGSYYTFHGTLSGSTLTLDDQTGPFSPTDLVLHPGTSSDFQSACNGISTAHSATETAVQATASAILPNLNGTWAVAESNVVCTPGPGQPASICSGNLANYSFIIKQSTYDLDVTIPPAQVGGNGESLVGELGAGGAGFSVSGHIPLQNAQGINYGYCQDKYTASSVSSSQLSGTYTTQCMNNAGAVLLNQTGDWIATKQP